MIEKIMRGSPSLFQGTTRFETEDLRAGISMNGRPCGCTYDDKYFAKVIRKIHA